MKEVQENKVILGLMRLDQLTSEQLVTVLRGALALGIHDFDISGIYCNHDAEWKLGEALRLDPSLRSQMFIQTKCGIVRENGKTTMDLSRSHILEAVDASLKRMGLETIDCLLLHRVDIFMDAKEIGSAFNQLKKEGKVRHFGVSNMDMSMIEYLESGVSVPLEVDQLQCGLGQLSLISQCFNVNFPAQNPNLADGLFFGLKRKGMVLQCWSPYQIGFFEGSIFDRKRLPKLNEKLDELALKYHSTPCGIATAFLSMLGNNVQIITGSMNLAHIQEAVEGAKLVMSKEDWYDCYQASGNLLP